MAVFLDKDGFEPSLEQVAVPAMIFVEELGIDSVQLPHAEGEITVRRLDEEMVMVGHQAIGVAYPVVALVDVLECIKKSVPIVVVFENGFLFISPRCDMINCASIFYAKRAGHEARLPDNRVIVKPQDLTL